MDETLVPLPRPFVKRKQSTVLPFGTVAPHTFLRRTLPTKSRTEPHEETGPVTPMVKDLRTEDVVSESIERDTD